MSATREKPKWNEITKTILWFMVASLVCLNALLLSLCRSVFVSMSLFLYISFLFGCIRFYASSQWIGFYSATLYVPIHRYNTLALASVPRDFAIKTTTTMITSKCYSENRFEMAFKIRHTKLWMNAIKMHIHFYYFSIVIHTHTHTLSAREQHWHTTHTP